METSLILDVCIVIALLSVQHVTSPILQENVEGSSCDTCLPGSYYLQEDNLKGCTSCFCFGVTKACGSSNFILENVCVPCVKESFVLSICDE